MSSSQDPRYAPSPLQPLVQIVEESGQFDGWPHEIIDLIETIVLEARMLDWDKVTWTCDICRKVRPDRFIDVAYRPITGMEEHFPKARFNLKFCNDSVECKAQAHGTGPWSPSKEN